MLIAVAGMLALVLVVLLVIALNRPGPDQQALQPDPWEATNSPAPASGAMNELLSEEEMGRQAMSEEEDRDEPVLEDDLPVD